MITLFGAQVGGVCLDCDGVLVDSEPVSELAWSRTLARFGIDVERFDAWVGRTDAEIARHYAALIGTSPDELAAAADEALADELTRGVEPFADAVTLVDRVEAAGVPCAVVSNSSRRRLDRVLSAAGLAGRFSVTVSSSDVALPKPAPDVYLRAVELLGADRCLAIEDSPTGVAAARAAGLVVVAVDRGVFPPAELSGADRVVTDLGEG